MEEYDALVAAVGNLENLTEDQKATLLGRAKKLNVELGIRGSDILGYKGKLAEANTQNSSHKEFTDMMSKFNLKAEDIKKAADFAGFKQTQDEATSELKGILSTSQTELKKAQEIISTYKNKELLAPKFKEAVDNYKDTEGKEFNFMPDFLGAVENDLYKGITGEVDEVVVNDRIRTALERAKSDQMGFLKRNNLMSSDKNFHQVDDKGGGGSTNTSGINAQDIQTVLTEGKGSVDAAVMAMAMSKVNQ